MHTLINPYGIELYLVKNKRQFNRLAKLFKGANLTWVQTLGSASPIQNETYPEIKIIIVYLNVEGHRDTNALTLTVVHEATHAACMALDMVGQSYDGHSEALAYLVEWITDWLLSRLTKEFNNFP